VQLLLSSITKSATSIHDQRPPPKKHQPCFIQAKQPNQPNRAYKKAFYITNFYQKELVKHQPKNPTFPLQLFKKAPFRKFSLTVS